MKINLRKEFYKTKLKSRMIYYIYSGISAVLLFVACFFGFIGENYENAVLLTELSCIMLGIGIWGGVFSEIFYKKYKK